MKYKGDIRKTWSLVNGLIGKSKTQICQSLLINGSKVTDQKVLADEFNKYFSSIAEKMKEKLPQSRINYRSYLPPSPTRSSIYF